MGAARFLVSSRINIVAPTLGFELRSWQKCPWHRTRASHKLRCCAGRLLVLVYSKKLRTALATKSWCQGAALWGRLARYDLIFFHFPQLPTTLMKTGRAARLAGGIVWPSVLPATTILARGAASEAASRKARLRFPGETDCRKRGRTERGHGSRQGMAAGTEAPLKPRKAAAEIPQESC